MSNPNHTEQALSELEIIKQHMLRGPKAERQALSVDSVDNHIMLNISALMAAACWTVYELIGTGVTGEVLYSAHNLPLQFQGVTFIGLTLAVILAAVYGYIFYRAQQRRMDVRDYSERYFGYFRNFSALSDIFVKFCVFGMLIFANKPEWIGALFMLYVGDVVFQGRLFVLTPLTSVALGGLCLTAGVAMLFTGVVAILWPLLAFALVTSISLINALQFRQKLAKAEG